MQPQQTQNTDAIHALSQMTRHSAIATPKHTMKRSGTHAVACEQCRILSAHFYTETLCRDCAKYCAECCRWYGKSDSYQHEGCDKDEEEDEETEEEGAKQEEKKES